MEDRLKRLGEFFHIFDQWISLYEEGINIDVILKKNKFYKVAIYGMGTMAIHMVKALENTGISVECIIVEKKADYYINVPVLKLDEVSDELDAVVYTNPNEKAEVISSILQKLNCKVVSLADVVFDNIE